MISNVDGEAVDRVLAQWAREQGVQLPGNVIALDGKSLRGSHGADRQKQVHLVAAFTHREGVVVAQQQVADKSNEIPAARVILDSMDLAGTTVTMDAMHAQAATAEIVAKKRALPCDREGQPAVRRRADRGSTLVVTSTRPCR